MGSPYTTLVGSIAARDTVRRCVAGVEAVVHCATLHKPHVGSHTRTDFIETNIAGTLNLLEEAVAANVSRFIFTSTTSAFGRANAPAEEEPAAWITEDVAPVPRNIYGTTKVAAEDLCELIARDYGLRLFPDFEDVFQVRGWRMFDAIERVYVKERARRELGWLPRHDFRAALDRLAEGEGPRSELARSIGAKGYHEVSTDVYTVR